MRPSDNWPIAWGTAIGSENRLAGPVAPQTARRAVAGDSPTQNPASPQNESDALISVRTDLRSRSEHRIRCRRVRLASDRSQVKTCVVSNGTIACDSQLIHGEEISVEAGIADE
jgi:hypothetical protein